MNILELLPQAEASEFISGLMYNSFDESFQKVKSRAASGFKTDVFRETTLKV